MKARAWAGGAVATGAAVVALALWPGRSHVIVVAWAVGMLAWGLLKGVGGVRLLARARSEFDDALAPSSVASVRPDDLARCERTFGWKTYAARDFDHHVRPFLTELLEHRVGEAGRSGAVLELGAELHALRDKTAAEDLYGATVTTDDVERIIARIEDL